MKKLNLFCIALLFCFSCEKENQVDDKDNFIQVEIDSVLTGIDFHPYEGYDGYNIIDTPDLELHFFSTKSYMGGTYRLACSQFLVKNELIIRFDSIQSYALTNFLPTRAKAEVGLPENVKKITLVNGHAIDTYEVSISEEKVEIDSISRSFSNVSRNKMFRYPENTFNFTCWADSVEENLCVDFLSILNDELTLTEYEYIGEGSIPYPYYTSSASDHYTAVYKYEKESDYDRAGELLKQFTLENIPPDEGKSISLIGWNNKKFHSYIFQQ